VAGAPAPIGEVPEEEWVQCDALADAGVLEPTESN
jgi:hypothetical protein